MAAGAGEARLAAAAAGVDVVLARCRERRCDYVFLGTDEGDVDAHRLYERFGFSNRAARAHRRERSGGIPTLRA